MEGLAKEADRWFRQAENDLKAAEWNQQGGFYAHACFWAQQSTAKALRAFLFMNKEDAKETRSVSELLDSKDSREAIKAASDALALVEEKRKEYVPEKM